MVDHRVPLDVVTLSTLMDVHCKEGKMREAESILEFMVKMNVCPNIITYGSMIEGYCKSGNVDEAWRMLQEIPCIGLKQLGIYIKPWLDEEAKCLLNEMQKNGCAPDDVTYNFIVYSLLKRNKVYEAIIFVEEMQNRGFKAHSDNVSMILDMVVKGKGIDINLLEVVKKVVPQLKNELSDVF
ncbi:hypothetical protein ACS0TY_019249 [Phlomoides rotata]